MTNRIPIYGNRLFKDCDTVLFNKIAFPHCSRLTNVTATFRYYGKLGNHSALQRKWKSFGRTEDKSKNAFTLMSYNILAQQLVDCQPFLYCNHKPGALLWSHRFDSVKREIDALSPDILCLQEVQQNHLPEIAAHFNELGYDTSLYKKRSGLQVDGCAIFFRSDMFELIESHFVDYFQPNIKILNRCNVAIISKLALKSDPGIKFVVGTTHLLFNPKRHDIRLAQVQVLMAELDRIARADEQSNKANGSSPNLPIILTGDFNVQQDSQVFRFVIGESVSPEKLFRTMNFQSDSSNLLPFSLGISDDCQHLDVVINSNRYQTALHTGLQSVKNGSQKSVTKRTITVDDIEKSNLPFNTGVLKHNLNLLPTICAGKPFKMDHQHASTYHNKWIMVDYIFFSNSKQTNSMASKLRLLENYQLPTIQECLAEGPIPNGRLGSDHYSIAARFAIE